MQELLQAGASGYVLKQSKSEELIRAILAVAAGRAYLDPAITESAVTQLRESGHVARGVSPQANLTAREADVLRLIALGYVNKEVAARLNLSIKTVEAHKSNAMNKNGHEKPGRHRALRHVARLAEGYLGTCGKNPRCFPIFLIHKSREVS